MEQYSNNGNTTLASSLTSSSTSLSVTSATGFPSSGNFRISIDTEILKVTAVSGTTWTVVRGTEGTTGASHASGAAVLESLTSESLRSLNSVISQTGTFASLPSSPLEGFVYYPTDCIGMYRYNGTSWDKFVNGIKVTQPVAANFSWTNQSITTLVDQGALNIEKAGSSGGSSVFDISMFIKATPSSPFTAQLGNIFTHHFQGYCEGGICLYESSSGKIITFGTSETDQMTIAKWSDKNTYSGHYMMRDFNVGSYLRFMQIYDDGTNYNFSISHDAQMWTQVFSIAKNDFFATAADHIGPYVYNNNTGSATYNVISSVVHYED